MKKFWTVQSYVPGTKFDANPFFTSKADAIDQAKRMAAQNSKQGYAGNDVVIVEAVATIKAPVPEYDVIDIK